MWNKDINNYYGKNLLALETDYLRKSARIWKLDYFSNWVLGKEKEFENILGRIGNKSFKSFGYVLLVCDERWTKILYQWKPDGRRKRGRRKNNVEKNMVMKE